MLIYLLNAHENYSILLTVQIREGNMASLAVKDGFLAKLFYERRDAYGDYKGTRKYDCRSAAI